LQNNKGNVPTVNLCNIRLFLSTVFMLVLTHDVAVSGLGTSTSKEAKEYFSDMARHRIPFKYAGAEDDASIVLVSTCVW